MPAEYPRLRPGQVILSYLHLAASADCTRAILRSGAVAIGYETVQPDDGSLPLLAPMSQLAGRMAPQIGAHVLQRAQGGRGVLLGGVPGVAAASVVILGAGVAGSGAAAIAVGMRARVTLIDVSVPRLRAADLTYRGRVRTVTASMLRSRRPACGQTWSSAPSSCPEPALRCWSAMTSSPACGPVPS